LGILHMLSLNGGCMRLDELASLLGITRNRARRLAWGLTRRGLVRRVDSDFCLSSKGRSVVKRIVYATRTRKYHVVVFDSIVVVVHYLSRSARAYLTPLREVCILLNKLLKHTHASVHDTVSGQAFQKQAKNAWRVIRLLECSYSKFVKCPLTQICESRGMVSE